MMPEPSPPPPPTPLINDPKLLFSAHPVLNISKLEHLLLATEFPDPSFILDGFITGFELGYEGPYQSIETPNLTSAKTKPTVMASLLNKEVEAGRILGPYSSPPFAQQIINPIGLVPKKEPHKFRMIVDLSQPTGLSVNSHIPRQYSAVQYPSVQTAIDTIVDLSHTHGSPPFLSKLDIKNAFRLIPMSPLAFPLMGLKFQDQFFVDAFLPMGASSSCKIFQQFSNAFTSILYTHGNCQHVINYLDDFLLIAPSHTIAVENLNSFNALAQSIAIPIAEEKTEGPSQCLTFLGIELDCTNLEARLPQEKIAKAISSINKILSRPVARTKKLESLHGYLNYCAQIIPAGKAFIRSLSQLIHSPSPWVTLSTEIKQDLETWLSFLQQFNGKAMFHHSQGVGQPDITLHTDSSGSWGCAAIIAQEYITVKWPSDIPRSNLALLELYPIVLASYIWSRELANLNVKIFCDNLAVVHIINNLKSKDQVIMKLVRLFTLNCLTSNIWFQATHISTKDNLAPDSLSRGQFDKFSRAFPHIHPRSATIPHHLRPEILLIQ